MAEPSNADTTQLLRAWANGDSEALAQLTPRVYRKLRRLAARLLQNERPGYSLQSTDLVHEAYLRLVNAHELDWQHRTHFFAVAATLMRRILLDRARRRAAGQTFHDGGRWCNCLRTGLRGPPGGIAAHL